MSINSRHLKLTASVAALGLLLVSFGACSKKTAEEKGAEMAAEKLDMAKGIGGVLEEKGSAAAESLTTGMGKVVKGIGKGVEKSGRVIVVDATVEAAGLQITKLQNATGGGDIAVHGLEAYVVANSAAKGKMRVLAYDLTDHEIGRAKVDFVREADEARYLYIPFDSQVNIESIARVAFDFQAEAPATAKK